MTSVQAVARQVSLAQSPALDGESLRDRAHRFLLAALVTGELAPDVIYSVPTLAKSLGMSATPVREAMLDLAGDGLVEAVLNRGFVVRRLTGKELDDISQLRQQLESWGSGLACRRLAAEDLAGLRRLIAVIRRAARAGQVADYLEADRQFHMTILAAAGNAELVATVERLRNLTRLYNLTHLARERKLDGYAQEHAELLAALEARDTELVERLVSAHIAHTRGSWARPDRGEAER